MKRMQGKDSKCVSIPGKAVFYPARHWEIHEAEGLPSELWISEFENETLPPGVNVQRETRCIKGESYPDFNPFGPTDGKWGTSRGSSRQTEVVVVEWDERIWTLSEKFFQNHKHELCITDF